MDVNKKEVTVEQLVDGFKDKGLDGCWAYGGKLNVRPEYQRAFRYKPPQQVAVVDTVIKELPLNTMYWHLLDDGTFTLIDGQQRTCSICEFATNNIAFSDGRYFNNFHDDEREKFLNYRLHIYTCEGTDSERLAWFKIINFAGESLTWQELRNATFPGPWLQNAKKRFSDVDAAGPQIAGNLVGKKVEDQSFLETALKWVSADNIEDYMAIHQKDKDASDLWADFQTIVNWVRSTFPEYRKQMKGLDWGRLHREHKNDTLNSKTLEDAVLKLMSDEDVQDKNGIYEYVLKKPTEGKEAERFLNIRGFRDADKTTAYNRQKGKCAVTGENLPIEKMEADHIIAWSKGGPTTLDNLRMVKAGVNKRKSNK